MPLPKRINNWFQHAKKYFFTYNDGFFELSYLDNSPKAMIESFMKMPFVTHNATEQILRTNNVFSEGILHYQELEDGLWVINSEMKYKANVCYKVIYDAYIPCDYYMLNFHVNTNSVLGYSTKVLDIVFPSKSWLVTKRQPHQDNLNIFNFKNSYSTDLSIYFSKTWVDKNLENDQVFIESRLNDFFHTELNHILLPETSTDYDQLIQGIKTTVLTKSNKGVANSLRLKVKVMDLISTFIEKYTAENKHENLSTIANIDLLKILKIEKHLCENLENKFESIDALAERFQISPTKLKNDFKRMFGKSIFQYFQEKQMLLAKEIMENEDVLVKKLAYKFGYDNVGKFSQAYKKHFNILPSEQLKTA